MSVDFPYNTVEFSVVALIKFLDTQTGYQAKAYADASTRRRVDASPPVARAHQSREINCVQVQGNKFGNDQTPPVEGAASG